MTEYLDSAYFMKKYGVDSYTMRAYREKSSFDLVKDEVSRTWKYPKEAEEEIAKFCEEYKRNGEIAERSITIGQLKKMLDVTETMVLNFIKKNNIKITLVNRMRYIDKKHIDFFKENLKPKKNKHNYCPICKRPLNDLGEGEKYCKPCNKYFLRSKEITYGEDGSIRLVR